jgi:GTP cyclohydrolase IA
MKDRYFMTWQEVAIRIGRLQELSNGEPVYGIPRGGQIVAGLMGTPAHMPAAASWLVDDIWDSGATSKRWEKETGLHCLHLVDKRVKEDAALGWVVFPWEVQDTTKDIEDTVTRQLEFMGEDPTREGLLETPKRVIKALAELTSGYQESPVDILSKTFNVDCDQMVIVQDIEYWSLCEHHMLPFQGKAHVAYLPDSRVVGLSKIPRAVHALARRLQVQERLTEQIADVMVAALAPQGVGVVLTGQHLCCAMRGAKAPVIMKTSALRGRFYEADMRAEFLSLLCHP